MGFRLRHLSYTLADAALRVCDHASDGVGALHSDCLGETHDHKRGMLSTSGRIKSRSSCQNYIEESLD
jgi:hypothetical protein